MHMAWSGEDIEKRLYEIMKDIHNKCVQCGTEGDYINYRKGANIAGFVKVVDAMVACGNIYRNGKREKCLYLGRPCIITRYDDN